MTRVEEMLNLATGRHRASDLTAARDLCRKIVAEAPQCLEAWRLLGLICYQTKDYQAALGLIGKALEIRADAECFFIRGLALLSLRRPDEAVKAFREAAALPPAAPAPQIRLASALCHFKQFTEALSCIRKVVETRPDDPEALHVYSKTLSNMGSQDAALEVQRRLVALTPTDEMAKAGYALLLLRRGDFAEGWRVYEQCFALSGGRLDRSVAQGRWDGGDVSGKTLLIYAEGGFGDSIQFARYVPMLAGRAGELVLELPEELISLFSSLTGPQKVVRRGEPLPRFDAHLPLPSLAAIFRTELSSIPDAVPYLTVPPERLAKCSGRVPAGGGLNIGVCWAGNRANPSDQERSVAPGVLAPLAKQPGTRWFSLQIGKESNQRVAEWPGLINLTGDIHDFADTAALMSQLDLVISVDTSVAHLAGALGRPVWLLLPFVADYRWLLNRKDSPWYPTMRLFRQTAIDEWSRPIAEMAEALRAI